MAVASRLLARLRPHSAVLILIAVILLIAAGTLTYPLGRDQGEFATLGRGLLTGKIPYVDLWNPKPPAVFYVYAAAMSLFGQTAPALRAIDLIIFPLIALALYAIGSRLADRRVGVWTVALFGVFYFTETFWTLTQNDGIALLPMTLALWCAIRTADAAGQRRSWLWALIGGLLVGCAFWFKYPFALIAVPAAALYYSLREVGDKRHIFWDIGGFIAGGLLSLVGTMVILMQIGAWNGLLESARLTAGYTALTANFADLFAALQIALGYRWSQWGLLVIAALIGMVAIARRIDRRWWVIAGWLLTGLVIMLVQAKGYDYHWLPMLPPLALIGALGITTGLSFFSVLSPRTSVLLSRVFLAALLFIMAFVINARAISYVLGSEGQISYYTNFVAGEFSAAELQRVADLLRERVVPGDSLFIWGFRPEIYYLSGLNPATRFIFQFPLVAEWYPPEWREQTADLLWAAVPPYVLVAQVDYMPWVTGSENDSNTLLQQYPELNDWLMYNYVLELAHRESICMATKELVSVRAARAEDIPVIIDLIKPFVEEGTVLARTVNEMDELLPSFLVAEEDGEVIGCVVLEIYSPKLAEIRSLAVSRSAQGKGVGRRLVEACIARAHERRILEVMAITSADGFFQSCGFDYTMPGAKRALFLMTRDKN